MEDSSKGLSFFSPSGSYLKHESNMRTISYFSNQSLRRHSYIANCSECGEFAERYREDEMEKLCVEHSFGHISQELQLL